MKYLDKKEKVHGCLRTYRIIIVDGQTYGFVNRCDFCPVHNCDARLREYTRIVSALKTSLAFPAECPLPEEKRGSDYPNWKFPERKRDWFISRIGTGEKIYHLPVSFTCSCSVCQGWRQKGYIESEIPKSGGGIRDEWHADYYFTSQHEHGGFFPSLKEYYESYPLMKRES